MSSGNTMIDVNDLPPGDPSGGRGAPALRTTPAWAWVVGVCLIAVAVAVRWPGFVQGGFKSHDVAGILYNGMLLTSGALPYVDDLEIKAPGSFYLAAWWAGPEGRDIARFQVAANLYAIVGLALVFGIGVRLWGPLGGCIGAGLYGLHDAFLDSMDANYVTWAQLPMLLALGASLEALRGDYGRRGRAIAWVVAGVACGLAILCKQPSGALLVPIQLAAWQTSRPLARGARRDGDPWWVTLGVGLSHVPIALHYGLRGEIAALLDGYVLNTWSVRYIARGTESGLKDGLQEGVLAASYFMALPLALAFFAGLAPSENGGSVRRRTAFLWGCLVATMGAAAVGLRFYQGYFLAVLPSACLLAAAPWGLLGQTSGLRRSVRLLLLVPIVALAARQVVIVADARKARARSHDEGARTIARHIDRYAPEGESIWIWGWHLWDVYALTGRRSASRIYKGLGLLTTSNDDTWRRPSQPLRFIDSELSRRHVRELEAHRPCYIVIGSTVPAHAFTELNRLLEAHYERDTRTHLGRVAFWRRRDPPPEGGEPLAPQNARTGP